ncbi:hypothetical protein LUX73_18955 [Actinomadura madurae]|nr:dTMP kinase [Actinomadura madurae]MCQ0006533.1 hypothetical protein [Actinomadura madurae]
MDRGAIVVSDRYVDSSLAYQGFGRQQAVEDIARVNAWATGGLVPDLTVLLEIPPQTGLGRLPPPPTGWSRSRRTSTSASAPGSAPSPRPTRTAT